MNSLNIEVKNWLTNTSIVSGCLIGLLSIIDWILTEKQKKKLQLGAETFWVWLATRSYSRLASLVMNKTFNIAIIAFTCFFVFLLSYAPKLEGLQILTQSISIGRVSVIYYYSIIIITAILFYKFFIPQIFSRIIIGGSHIKFYIKFIICAAAVYISIPIINYSLWIIFYTCLRHSFDNNPSYFIKVHPTYIDYCIDGVSIAQHILLYYFDFILAFSIAWEIILVPLLMGVFKSIEFAIYRIAQHKNGIVLGFSGLLIGLGALVKALLT